MSPDPLMVLLLANVRAGELRAEAGLGGSIALGVLVGAPTHSGAHLLEALDEQGWELRPKTACLSSSETVEIAERLVAVAHAGVGMDDVHRALSVELIEAVLDMIEAAGLVVCDPGDRR
jgi:hypothetical protein